MKLNKKVVKRALVISIPILMVWILFIGFSQKNKKNQIIENVIHQNEIKDSNTEFLVDNYIDEIIENLKIIRDSDEFLGYLNNTSDDNLEQVERLFRRVMSNKEDYDQLRLIDYTGQEIIRVDNMDDDTIKVYTSAELQDKSERYYFLETKALTYDDVFISPLDLNIENGIVELPHKPMIRFATPLYNEEDVFIGILIINYKAEYFVNILEEHESHKDLEKFWFYIVNRYGEFILHQDSSKNFSFMFKENSNLNFDQIDSTIWQEIESSNFGYLEKKEEIVSYYDVLAKTRSEIDNYEERWIAIHRMDISTLLSPSAILKEMLLINNLAIFVLIILFSYIYSFVIEKLKKSDSRLEITELIAGSTNDGVMITDANTNIIYVNDAFQDITGYKKNEVIGRQPRDFKSGKQDDKFYDEMWSNINKTGLWEGMIWDKKKSGVLYPQKMRIIAVKDKKSDVHHYVSIFTDVSAEKNRSNTLQSADQTGENFFVPNEDMMLQLLRQSVEDKEFSFMVLYIVIENFNQLVTSFSDFELNSAELFINSIKPLLHEEDFIAQTGRNMFAVIIGTKNLDEEPKTFVEKVQKGISNIIEVNGRDFFFKTRMGVSFWPYDTDDLKKLILNSIIALEWSANRSTSEIAFFNEEMINELNKENEIEGYLRKAMDNEELYMVFQPQIDSQTNAVIGLEALIRWHNASLGNVPPSVFIPIAERSNLIIEIGYWIIEEVCKNFSEILSEVSFNYKDMRCAINLSAIQLQEGAFLEKLFNIVDTSTTSYNNIEIEITESLLLTNQNKSIKLLEEMQDKNITIAIDDFGTGYSSLSYLKSLPIDKIKIDRSFIKDYPENDDGELVKILVNMAETLKIDVLTEGAETKEQVDFLSQIGCLKIQGYYYSKPLVKDKLIQFLNDRTI